MTAKQIKVTRWDCKCKKCGQEWRSRTEEKPALCRFCKTPHWEKGKPKKEEK